MNLRHFETDRLLLSPTHEHDAGLVLELFNTPGWLQYIGDRKVHTLQTAESYIERNMRPQHQRLGFGSFTLSLKVNQKKIGLAGLYDRAGVEGIDIGFALLPEYGGKGYAYEAASCLRDAAFLEFQLPAISAITQRDNLPSRQLLEKLGMTLKSTVVLPGDTQVLLLYYLENPSRIP